MTAQTNQMKKTAKSLVAPTTFDAVTRGNAFQNAGSAMVIEIVLTIRMKQTVLKWCRHVAAENSSVKMARVFIRAGVVMAIQTAKTIQMS